jgi:DNA-binding GntR family transcriptional regulator
MPEHENNFPTLSVEPVSIVDRVADELRRALFEGELEPGTALREVALAESLGVARSTVREALGLLVADGLADRIPNKGTAVHALDADDIRDVCHARLVLESSGIERWDQASEQARDEVRAALTEFNRLTAGTATSQEITAAHLAIHRALAGLNESPRLLGTADALYAEIRLALAGVDRARGNVREQAHAHGDLVRLLERGHIAEALTDLREHLAGAEQSLLETVPAVDAP